MVFPGTNKRAVNFGPTVLVFFTNGAFDRGHDAAALARAWLKLGPEAFRQEYKFDWTPPHDLMEQAKAEIGGVGE